ncbi:MAG TPA: hypothetical protein VNA16_09970, partial [Abditibacteriaceae bacterium]|nr:hypothetical protein [Abditibacteriaceae bacterium]
MTLESLAQSYQVAVLAPEIMLTISALVVLLAGTMLPDSWQRRLLPILALTGTGATVYCTRMLWNREASFGAIYVVDNFALFFKGIFLIGL